MTPAKPTPTGRTLHLGWSGAEESSAEHPGGAPTGPAPEQGRARSRTRLALAGALVAILALVLILPRLLVGGPGPEELVRGHLEALVAADVATVRKHLDTGQDASDAALTTPILEAAEDRVTGFTIDAVEQSGRQAAVTATLRTGATSQQATFTARAESTGPFTRTGWVLDPVPSAVFTVTVPEQAQQLLVNGVELPLSALPTRETSAGQRVLLLRLLPGTHTLQLPAGDALLEPAAETLEVPVPGRAPPHAGAVVGYDLSEEGRSRAISQIDQELEACAGSTLASPEHCPFTAAHGMADGTSATIGDEDAGTWEVRPPAGYRIDHHAGMTWTLVSEPAQSVFTPAPGSDGGTAPREISFIVHATVVIDASGELSVTMRQNEVTIVDSCPEEGNSTAVDLSQLPGDQVLFTCDDED